MSRPFNRALIALAILALGAYANDKGTEVICKKQNHVTLLTGVVVDCSIRKADK